MVTNLIIIIIFIIFPDLSSKTHSKRLRMLPKLKQDPNRKIKGTADSRNVLSYEQVQKKMRKQRKTKIGEMKRADANKNRSKSRLKQNMRQNRKKRELQSL